MERVDSCILIINFIEDPGDYCVVNDECESLCMVHL